MTRQDRVLVVGTDLGPMGDDAILQGLELLALGGRALHLVHVLEPTHLGEHGPAAIAQTLAEVPAQVERHVRYVAVLNQVTYEQARVHTHVRLGSATSSLLQACIDLEADLLILGTHGRQGIGRLLLGSIAEALVRKAHCPVLVARPVNYSGLPKTPLVTASPGSVESQNIHA